MTKEERFEQAYLMLLHWIEAIYLGNRVADFFIEENIKTIAIYGMGDMANRLMDALAVSEVSVLYGIDRDPACSLGKLEEVYVPNDDMPNVDAIVVTPFYAFESIKEVLSKKNSCRIISIEEVIWSL